MTDIVSIVRRLSATLTKVENKIWVLHSDLGVDVYDFDFGRNFQTSHPYAIDGGLLFLRIGGIKDYSDIAVTFEDVGLSLINTPEQYAEVTSLPSWYERLSDLTPASVWFDKLPTAADVEREFSWPVFVKGERQTNRHDATSVVANPGAFDALAAAWDEDPILGWQRMVVREFVELRQVSGETGTKVPPAFEFRTFWFDGECVGCGPYWDGFATYEWSEAERAEGLSVARRAAQLFSSRFYA